MPASRYDTLLDELREPAAHRRARTDIEQEKLLEREGLVLLLGVPDFYDDIEINQRLEERQLRSFKLPNLPQPGK